MRYLLWNTKLAGWHRDVKDGIGFITSHLDLAGRFEAHEAMHFRDKHARGDVVLLPEEGQPPRPSEGVMLVARERMRQVQGEGWTPEHDDIHSDGELAEAAVCYALPTPPGDGASPELWPWDESWWKPGGGRVRQLVKAGALICAEIDRVVREQGRAHDRAKGIPHKKGNIIVTKWNIGEPPTLILKGLPDATREEAAQYFDPEYELKWEIGEMTPKEFENLGEFQG